MRLFTLLFLLCCGSTTVTAQTLLMNEVHSVDMRQSGPIQDDTGVTGYYFLTRHEKERRVKGKKKPQIFENYHLELFDNDLNKLGEKVIRFKEGLEVRQVAYNGTYLAILMVNSEEEKKWIELVDGSGETVQRVGLKYGAFDKPHLYGGMHNLVKPMHAVPGGFIHVDSNSEKALGRTKYQIKFIANDEENRGWMARSSSSSKDYEAASFIAAGDSVALFNIVTRQKLLTQAVTAELRAINLRTGEVVFTREQAEGEASVMWSSGAFLDDRILIAGVDAGESNKAYTGAPEGLNALWLTLDGELIEHKRIPIQDVEARIALDNKEAEDPGNLYIHNLKVTSEGECVMAGEYYRSFNGGISIHDGIVVSLDDKFAFQATQLVEKGKTKNGKGLARALNGGIAIAKKAAIATVAALKGEFDYVLTNTDEDAVQVVYFAGRETTKEDERASAFITTVRDGAIEEEKLSFAADSDRIWIMPAKPGYLTVVEYNEDSQRLNAHMERLQN